MTKSDIEGLIHKLKLFLPEQYAEILHSYISDRYFRIKQEEAYSEGNKQEYRRVVLGSVLYLLYTCDIPIQESDTIATFADDTAILAVGNICEEASNKFQIIVNQIHQWA